MMIVLAAALNLTMGVLATSWPSYSESLRVNVVDNHSRT